MRRAHRAHLPLLAALMLACGGESEPSSSAGRFSYTATFGSRIFTGTVVATEDARFTWNAAGLSEGEREGVALDDGWVEVLTFFTSRDDGLYLVHQLRRDGDGWQCRVTWVLAPGVFDDGTCRLRRQA